MSSLRVQLGERSYDICLAGPAEPGLDAFVRKCATGTLAFLVSDEHVQPHADGVARSLEQAGFRAVRAILPPGEQQKSLAVASSLYDRLADARADRRTLVVALGGGVIGDLAGFVAATYNRGLPLLMIPTTLLAMVDSSVGGKTAVNHPRGKNLIGVFHQPAGVWIDTSMLRTLPEREFRSGLAEVVKYGVILDAEFFTYLEANSDAILRREDQAIAHIVGRSCQLKADVVEQDERETTGLRAVLNYGHTFAHAFETVAGYGSWLHGEAVAMGMVCASRLAERRGLIAPEITQRQVALLKAFGLPVVPDEWPGADLIAVMRNDKKSVAGQLRFILPVRLGEVRLFDDINEADVLAVLEGANGVRQ